MGQPPKSYDDIVRDTVLDPDGSKRPSVAQEAEGRCPVSNAYRGTMQITVDARVA